MRINRGILAILGIVITGILSTQSLAAEPKLELATFAGGCFWCMEPPFFKLDGVVDVQSGYTGGKKENPTYEEVGKGATGHCESVQIKYDPKKVTYEKLLFTYWRSMDPTDGGGQFADRGNQYRPEIFYHTEKQRKTAEKSKADLEKSKRFSKPIIVPITKATRFYPAEEYHQHYFKKDPERYNAYRKGSGRAGFLEKTWGFDIAH
jgi:methionine-S-sulfoxide reductase